MALDIGNNAITQGVSGLVITTTAASMTLNPNGIILRPGHTVFQAIGAQTGTWVYWTTDGWQKVPFATANPNVGSCFSVVNSRFTAPVTGRYFFQASAYLMKDHANNGYYFHPNFWVNGGQATNGATSASLRLRGYGIAANTYLDSQTTQVIALNAGDYVEHYCYSAGGWNGTNGNRYYPNYTRFTGFLLG